MKLNKLIILFLLAIQLPGYAQIGGESTFEFLNLTNSARMGALGGNQIALGDSTDLNTSYNNPALLSREMTGLALANYVSYIAGINYGYAAWAFDSKNVGPISLGVQYINYGKFTNANAEGEREGTFNAAEYALMASWARQIKQFRLGITVKPLLSSLESYQSIGLAFDLGAAYSSPNQQTTLGLVLRNIGTQLTTYYEGAGHESLPFDLQLGIGHKLAHAPLHLLATMQHLQRWQLLANDPDMESKATFGKNLLAHLVLGAELLPSENFHIRAGYNFQRREELSFDENKSTVGFSWGFGFRIKRFRFDYGSARYHLASSSNHFSVAFRLQP